MKKQDLYMSVLIEKGDIRQQDKCIEEMSELSKAVLKYRYDKSNQNFRNVCDEISDVEITLEQMRIMFSGELVDKFKAEKLERLEKRLSSGCLL